MTSYAPALIIIIFFFSVRRGLLGFFDSNRISDPRCVEVVDGRSGPTGVREVPAGTSGRLFSGVPEPHLPARLDHNHQSSLPETFSGLSAIITVENV